MNAGPDSIIVLLRSSRSGDRSATGQLLEHYRNYLSLLARIQIGRRLQAKIDAADLVQDVFLAAHRGIASFRGTTEVAFQAWLRRILAGQLAHVVRRYCTTLARDVDLEQALLQELDDSSLLLDRGLVDQAHSPSESAARREQSVLLANALNELSHEYREVIILRQLEGLSFAEIAARMERSVDSVQKLWVRALDRLRKSLDTVTR